MRRVTVLFLLLVLPLQILAADVMFKKSKVVTFREDRVVEGQLKQEEMEAVITFKDSLVAIKGADKDYTDHTDIPYSAITQMLYERSSHSRVAAAILVSPLALFVKRKHHWFTFHYTAPDSSQKSILIRLDKNDEKLFRQVASTRTGMTVENIVE